MGIIADIFHRPVTNGHKLGDARLRASVKDAESSCPECGSKRFGYPRSDPSDSMCRDCGHKWNRHVETVREDRSQLVLDPLKHRWVNPNADAGGAAPHSPPPDDDFPLPFDEPKASAQIAALPGLSDGDRSGLLGAVKSIYGAGAKAVRLAKAVTLALHDEAKLWATRLAAAGITYEDALPDAKELSNPLTGSTSAMGGVDVMSQATGIPAASFIAAKLVAPVATFAVLKIKSLFAGRKAEGIVWEDEADARAALIREFRAAMGDRFRAAMGEADGEADDPAGTPLLEAVEPPADDVAGGDVTDAGLVALAMLKAKGLGDDHLLAKLAEVADDPEALQQLLDELAIAHDDANPVAESVVREGESVPPSRTPPRPGLVWKDQTKRWVRDPSTVAAKKVKGTPDEGADSSSTKKPTKAATKKATKQADMTTAKSAVTAALADPSSVQPHQLATLADHLKKMTLPELKAHLKNVKGKVSGAKLVLVDRLLDHVKNAKPATPAIPPVAVEPTPSEPSIAAVDPAAMNAAWKTVSVMFGGLSAVPKTLDDIGPLVDILHGVGEMADEKSLPKSIATVFGSDKAATPASVFAAVTGGATPSVEVKKTYDDDELGKANDAAPDQSRPKLDIDQRMAVADYSQSGYKFANPMLRGQPVPDGAEGATRAKKIVTQLDAVFKKLKPFDKPIPVTRYLGKSGTPEVAAMVQAAKATAAAGGSFRMSGYVSTTTADDDHIRRMFAPPVGGVEMRIQAIKGLDMRPHSAAPEEDELLLPHDASYDVRKVEPSSTGGWIIHLTQRA